MKIDRAFIEKHRTARGGFTFAQCQALGAGWPPKKGWLDRAVLADHTAEAIAMFVRFADRAATKAERRAQRKDRNEQLAAARIRTIQPAAPIKRKRSRPAAHQQMAPRLPALTCDPASDEFLTTFQWRAVRLQALKLHGARCQCCGASPSNGAIMNVDHVKPRRLFPQLALELSNLQILCHDCNHGKGNWDQTDWRPEQTEAERETLAFLRSIAKHG